MTGRRVAVVGAGMTRFVRRAQETGKELAFQASRAALDAAEMKLDQVDAVCLTSAPDAFDGVHRKGDYLADGAGGWNKPFIRTYVGGGSGVFTAIQGWYTVASGQADVVLCVAEEKMSSCQPHPQGAFLTIFDNILERPLGPNLLWIFALEMNRYMQRYGLEKRVGKGTGLGLTVAYAIAGARRPAVGDLVAGAGRRRAGVAAGATVGLDPDRGRGRHRGPRGIGSAASDSVGCS